MDISEPKRGTKRGADEMTKPREIEVPPKKRTVKQSHSMSRADYDATPSWMRDGYYVVREGGEVVEQAFFESGIRTGLTVIRSGDGKEETFVNYENGIANGPYFSRGNLPGESFLQFGQFKNGQYHGTTVDMRSTLPPKPVKPLFSQPTPWRFGEGGGGGGGEESNDEKLSKISKMYIHQYHKGKLHGTDIYIKNDAILSTWDRKNAWLHGDSCFFDINGSISDKRQFQYNKLNGVMEDRAGKYYYVDDVKHGYQFDKVSGRASYYFEGEPCHKDHFRLYKGIMEKELQDVHVGNDKVFSPEAIAQIIAFLMPDQPEIVY